MLIGAADPSQSILVVTIPVIAGGIFAVLVAYIQTRAAARRRGEDSARMVMELAREMAKEMDEARSGDPTRPRHRPQRKEKEQLDD